MESHWASFDSQGLRIAGMTLLLDNQNEGAPTTAGARTWIDNFGLQSIYVAADPNFAMVPGNSVGTPQFSIIDPRTMIVVQVDEGWGGDYAQSLYTTAENNRTP